MRDKRDETERIAIFIDGANFSTTLTKLGLSLDYKCLFTIFPGAQGYYYTAVPRDKSGDSMRGTIAYLKWADFTVIQKPTKEYLNEDGSTTIKGNMDAEIVTDMLLKADEYDHLILFSGDGDFCYPIAKLQAMGKKCTVVSSTATHPPMLSSELRRQADTYISVRELMLLVEKVA